MALTKETKMKVVADYRHDKHDTGSTEVQVALLTTRINQLADHFKTHGRDHHSRYGLVKMVGRRKRLLSYLQESDPKRYQAVIASLDLRK